MTGDKYIAQIAGQLTEVTATEVGGTGSYANQIPALDPTGRLDSSMMPIGVTPEVFNCTTSENISAGSVVNIFNNTGTSTARNADNSNNRVVVGFVLASTTTGNTAKVYLEGIITGLSGLTPGALYFLSTVGAITATAPSGSGVISQQIGYALDANNLAFNPQPTITLA